VAVGKTPFLGQGPAESPGETSRQTRRSALYPIIRNRQFHMNKTEKDREYATPFPCVYC